MVRRSMELNEALADLPKPTGDISHPKPKTETEVVTLVNQLVRESLQQSHTKQSDIPQARPHAIDSSTIASKPSRPVTESARTRDVVHEQHNYSAEERFNNAVIAIELRYAEKTKPFEQTLINIRLLADTDPTTFYLAQPQVERLNASIRTLEEQRNAQIERARADYFFERGTINNAENDFIQQNFESLVRDFDEQINLVARHYDGRIQKIIDELDDFFPDRTIVQNHIQEKITKLLKELKQSEFTTTNAKKFERISQDIIDLMNLKNDLRNHRTTETERAAVLETELHNLLLQRTNEIEATRKRFEHAIQQNHARNTLPSALARAAIEERFMRETAPIRSKMKRLTEDMVRTPEDATNIETHRLALSQLFDTMRHLRDQELARLSPSTPKKPASQSTLASGLLEEYYYEPGAHLTKPART